MDNPYDYKALASGPTFIPDNNKAAKEILVENNLYKHIPDNIKKVIDKDACSNFDSSDLDIQDVIIGGILFQNQVYIKIYQKYVKKYG